MQQRLCVSIHPSVRLFLYASIQLSARPFTLSDLFNQKDYKLETLNI